MGTPVLPLYLTSAYLSCSKDLVSHLLLLFHLSPTMLLVYLPNLSISLVLLFFVVQINSRPSQRPAGGSPTRQCGPREGHHLWHPERRVSGDPPNSRVTHLPSFPSSSLLFTILPHTNLVLSVPGADQAYFHLLFFLYVMLCAQISIWLLWEVSKGQCKKVAS